MAYGLGVIFTIDTELANRPSKPSDWQGEGFPAYALVLESLYLMWCF